MAFLGAPQAIFLRNKEVKRPFSFGKKVGGRGEFHSELASCNECSLALSSLCWPLSAQAAELVSSQHCCCAFGKYKGLHRRCV